MATPQGASARRRLVLSVLVGLVAGAVALATLPAPLTPLVTWDTAALAYVCSVAIVLFRMDAEQTTRHVEREDPTRTWSDLILLFASVASLVAVGYVIVQAASGGSAKAVWVGLGVLSVVVSWAVVHTVFTLRYARLYYTGRDGGADFHQEDPPAYLDFAYLAFTIGMTYQVSDTELNGRAFRGTVLRHSLLSYLFGTVIVALTINLVAGLSR
jgi:uncharacterized membrane protein